MSLTSVHPSYLLDLADYLKSGYWEDTGRNSRKFVPVLENALPEFREEYLGTVIALPTFQADYITFSHVNMVNGVTRIGVNTQDLRDGSAGEPDIRNIAWQALRTWENVAAVEFYEIDTVTGAEDGAILFKEPVTDDLDAHADTETARPDFGPVPPDAIDATIQSVVTVTTGWVNRFGPCENEEDFRYNRSYTFQTYVHEIGHALGLGHSGNYNATGPNGEKVQVTVGDCLFDEDSSLESIMSYINPIQIQRAKVEDGEVHPADNYEFSDSIFSTVLTPQAADIIAIQELYGAPQTSNHGNTIYGWGATDANGVFDVASWSTRKTSVTIYDTGGIDTLNGNIPVDAVIDGFPAFYLPRLNIDLRPGATSDFLSTGNLRIFTDTIIENAKGGRRDDRIFGNDADNRLEGNDGNDTLLGGVGNDTLFGDQGNDLLFAGTGTNLVFGGDNSDTLVLYGAPENYEFLNDLTSDEVSSEQVFRDTSNGIEVAFSGIEMVGFDVDGSGTLENPGEEPRYDISEVYKLFDRDNDAPVIEFPPGILFYEEYNAILDNGSPPTTAIYSASIIDDRYDGPELQISLEGADAGNFRLDSNIASFSVTQVTRSVEVYRLDGFTFDYETQNVFDLRIKVDDPSLGSSPEILHGFTINVIDRSEPPELTLTPVDLEFPEDVDTSGRVKVADISVSDPDGTTGSFFLTVNGPDRQESDRFEADATGLYISAGAEFDFRFTPFLDLTVHLVDQTGDFGPGNLIVDSEELRVNFTDVNEAGTLRLENAIAGIAEGRATLSRTKVVDIVIDDPDSVTQLLERLPFLSLTGDDADLFEVSTDDAGLALYLKAGVVLDHETQSALDVTVVLDDPEVGTGPEDDISLTLPVTDLDEAPTAIGGDLTIAVDERGSTTLTVANINGVDVDSPEGELTFEIEAVRAGFVALSGAPTAAITSFTEAQLAAGEVQFVHDGGAPEDGGGIDLSLRDEGDGPIRQITFRAPGMDRWTAPWGPYETWARFDPTSSLDWLLDVTVDVDENDRPLTGGRVTASYTGGGPQIFAGTVIGFDSATHFFAREGIWDGCSDATPRYVSFPSVDLGDDDYVVFYENDNDDTDFTAVGTVSELLPTETIDVTVNDLNDTPELTLVGARDSLSEAASTAERIKIARIQISDEAPEWVSLSLSGSDGDLFEILNSELYVQADAVLDFETNPQLEVTITATDSDGLATSLDFVLPIEDSVEPPPNIELPEILGDLAADVNQSSSVVITPEDLEAFDADTPPDQLIFTVTDSVAGGITVSGTAVTSFTMQDVIDGNVAFLQDGTDSDSASFSVALSDGQPVEPRTASFSTSGISFFALASEGDGAATFEYRTGYGGQWDVIIEVDSDNRPLTGGDATFITTWGQLTGRITQYDDTRGFVTTYNGSSLFIAAPPLGTFAFGEAVSFDEGASGDTEYTVPDTATVTGGSATATISLDVTTVNQPATVTLSPVVTALSEAADTSSRIKIADIVIADDGLGTNTLALGGDTPELFEIDGNELFLAAGTALDFETVSVLRPVVNVDDTVFTPNPDDSTGFDLVIEDANEAPVLGLDPLLTEIDEKADTSQPIRVADLTILDDALGSNLRTLGGDHSNLFFFDEEALYLVADAPLDHELDPTLTVEFRLDDPTIGDGFEAVRTLEIDVLHNNTIPQIGGDLKIVGGPDRFTTVAMDDLTAIDDDEDGNELVFTVTSTRGGTVEVDGVAATGFLQSEMEAGYVGFREDADSETVTAPGFDVSLGDGHAAPPLVVEGQSDGNTYLRGYSQSDSDPNLFNFSGGTWGKWRYRVEINEDGTPREGGAAVYEKLDANGDVEQTYSGTISSYDSAEYFLFQQENGLFLTLLNDYLGPTLSFDEGGPDDAEHVVPGTRSGGPAAARVELVPYDTTPPEMDGPGPAFDLYDPNSAYRHTSVGARSDGDYSIAQMFEAPGENAEYLSFFARHAWAPTFWTNRSLSVVAEFWSADAEDTAGLGNKLGETAPIGIPIRQDFSDTTIHRFDIDLETAGLPSFTRGENYVVVFRPTEDSAGYTDFLANLEAATGAFTPETGTVQGNGGLAVQVLFDQSARLNVTQEYPELWFVGEEGAQIEIDWDQGFGCEDAGIATGGIESHQPVAPYFSTGPRNVQVRLTDANGNSTTGTYEIAVDVSAPLIDGFDLNAASDSGWSEADANTDDTTPTFDFITEDGAQLFVRWDEGEAFELVGTGTGVAQQITKSTAYEGDGVKAVTLRVVDDFGNISETTETITIDTTAPVISIFADRTLATFQTASTAKTSAELSFSVSGAALFEIDWGDGEGFVYVDQAFNERIIVSEMSGEYATDGLKTITGRFTDSAGNSATDSFDLIIDTTAPTNITLTPFVVPENVSDSTDPGDRLVGYLTATDANADLGLTFFGEWNRLEFDENGNPYLVEIFEIVGNEVRLVEGATLDFEDKSVYEGSVRVFDEAVNSYSEIIEIHVTDVPEPPDAQDDRIGLSVVAGSLDGPRNLDVAANDTDPEGGTLTLSPDAATSTNGAALSVSGDGQSIVYDPTGTAFLSGLASGATASDTFTYTVTDPDGESDTATVTVDLTRFQALAFETPANISVDENTKAVAALAISGGDAPTLSITGGADRDRFEIDADGNLAFVNAPDFENPLDVGTNPRDNVYEVEVSANDGIQTVARTFSVSVNDMPDSDVAQMRDIAQTGAASINHIPQTIVLDRSFANPVVFAKTTSVNGPAPVTVRIDDINADSFTLMLQEPGNEDGMHAMEDVSWLVVEAGSWELAGGTRLEVGVVETNNLSGDGFEAVTFTSGLFDERPAIQSQVQTLNGPDFVVTRQRDADAEGFRVAMQEEEAQNSGAHARERIGWLAIDNGRGLWDGRPIEAGAVGDRVTEAFADQSLSDPQLDGAQLFTSLSSFDGPDPGAARAQSVPGGFRVQVQEDTSADAETAHADENVDYLAIGGSGLLGARPARPVIAEWGSLGMDHTRIEVDFRNNFVNPVVIAQVVTENGAAPVIVRISDVSATGFNAYLQEADNEDGWHRVETVNWLVVEEGTWSLEDGTVIQAGSDVARKLSSEGHYDLGFAPQTFDAPPSVIAQVQSEFGPDFVAMRTRNVDSQGFDLLMQEIEAKNDGQHATEQVGWIAVSQGAGTAGNDLFEAGRTSDAVGDTPVAHDFSVGLPDPVLFAQLGFVGADPAITRTSDVTSTGFTVRAQEDTSADVETRHVPENVDFLALSGDGVLHGEIHRPVIAELGRMNLTHEPVTISLQHAFDDPVAFALIPSANGPDPIAVRISDVSASKFTFQLQEPDYEDGSHGMESVSWLVIEAGDWQLSDGTRISAGRTESDAMLPLDPYQIVDFPYSFDETPAVFSQVQSANSPEWVVTRQHVLQPGRFLLGLQEEEASQNTPHAPEVVGWLAIEQGGGFWDGHAWQAENTEDRFTDAFDRFEFDTHFETSPNLMASLATTYGRDPSALRYRDLEAGGVELQVMEEQSRDEETTHIAEAVSLLAIEGSGLLTGEAWAWG